MPTKSYSTSQVEEVRFEADEVVKILLENLIARCGQSYDFDIERPLVIRDGHAIIMRFVQKEISRETTPNRLRFKPLKVTKDEIG